MILYLHEGINIANYDGVYSYLTENKSAISSRKGANLRGAYRRGNWWVLNTPRLDMDFEGGKIITPYRTKSLRFTYTDIPWYASRDVYFITVKDRSISLKYVLALLNSKLYFVWLYNKGKRKGEMMEMYSKPLSEVPIMKLGKDEQAPYISLVDRILKAKEANPQANTSELEREIDRLVYQLYGLTEDEIYTVECQG